MSDYRSEPPVSGFAVGGVMFAAVLMILVGVFQTISGLTAIIDDEFFVVRAELHVRHRHDRLGLDPPASRHRRVPRRSESLRPEGLGRDGRSRSRS